MALSARNRQPSKRTYISLLGLNDEMIILERHGDDGAVCAVVIGGSCIAISKQHLGACLHVVAAIQSHARFRSFQLQESGNEL